MGMGIWEWDTLQFADYCTCMSMLISSLGTGPTQFSKLLLLKTQTGSGKMQEHWLQTKNTDITSSTLTSVKAFENASANVPCSRSWFRSQAAPPREKASST